MASALMPPVEVHIAHTESPNVHEIEASRKTGSREYLSRGCRALLAYDIDVGMWACTSGSFALGLDGARRQAEVLAEELQVPASSTSLAFLSALQELGIGRVAIAATYPQALSEAFRGFLADAGVRVIHIGCLGIRTGDEVGQMERAEVLRFAHANDQPEADALLIPDTALHTVDLVTELEALTGKTVLTANQVTLWEALRLAGRVTTQTGFGRLLTETTRMPG